MHETPKSQPSPPATDLHPLNSATSAQLNSVEIVVPTPEGQTIKPDLSTTSHFDKPHISSRTISPAAADESPSCSTHYLFNTTQPAEDNNQLPDLSSYPQVDGLLISLQLDEPLFSLQLDELLGNPETLFSEDSQSSPEQEVLTSPSQICREDQTRCTQLQDTIEEARRLSHEVKIKQQELNRAQQQISQQESRAQLLIADRDGAVKDNQHLNFENMILRHEKHNTQQQLAKLQTGIQQQKEQTIRAYRCISFLRSLALGAIEAHKNAQQETLLLQTQTQQQKANLARQSVKNQQAKKHALFAQKQTAKMRLRAVTNQSLLGKTARKAQHLQHKATIQQQKLQKLRQTCKKQTGIIRNMHKGLDNLTNRENQTAKRAREAEQASIKLKDQCLDQQALLHTANKERQKLRNEREKSQQILHEAQQQATLLKADQVKTTQKLNQLTQNLQEKEQELDGERQNILQQKTDYQQLKRQLDHESCNHKQIKHRAIKTHRKAKILRNKLHQASNELKNSHQAISLLKHRNQHLKHLKQSIQQTATTQKNIIIQLQKKLHKRRTKILNQQVFLNNATKELQELRSKRKDSQQKLQEAQQQVTQLKTDQAKTTQELQQLTQSLQQKEQELDNEQQNVLQLKTEHQQLNRQLNDQRNYSKQTSQQAETAQNEAITLRDRLRHANTNLNNANQAALDLKREIVRLKRSNQDQIKKPETQLRDERRKSQQATKNTTSLIDTPESAFFLTDRTVTMVIDLNDFIKKLQENKDHQENALMLLTHLNLQVSTCVSPIITTSVAATHQPDGKDNRSRPETSPENP